MTPPTDEARCGTCGHVHTAQCMENVAPVGYSACRCYGTDEARHRDYAGRTCTTGLLHSHDEARQHCTACGYRQGHAPECQKQWAEKMTDEARAGEPRTPSGVFLRNGLEAMGYDEASANEAIVAIEREAAAAPALDVTYLREKLLDGHPHSRIWIEEAFREARDRLSEKAP